MKRLVLSAILAVSLLVSPAQAFNWSGVFMQVQKSVVQLFHARGTCTAFSINQQKGYYLTAAHCLGENMAMWKEATTATGTQHTFRVLRVLGSSIELDLAVLEAAEGLQGLPRGRVPNKGDEVASIGYAFGEPEPFIIGAIITHIKEARSYGRYRHIIMKDNQDIGGMSGGPVVDTKGRLVGMVQQGVVIDAQVSNIAYGTAIDDLYEFTKSYWGS